MSVFPAPRTGAFDQVATQLETGLFRASVDLPNPPLSEAFNLADFAIQHYPVGARGIGIHRDGMKYRQIVVIITLEGASRLFTCADRQGRAKRRIDDRPGRLVLLSADGFAGRSGEDARPLHGVDGVSWRPAVAWFSDSAATCRITPSPRNILPSNLVIGTV